MCLSRNKKNNVYPCKPLFYYIKVGFKRVNIIETCYRDVDCAIPNDVFKAYPDTEGPVYPVHMHGLIRAFVICLQNHWILQNISTDIKYSDKTVQIFRMACRPQWLSWMRARLETRRSQVHPPRSAAFFLGD